MENTQVKITDAEASDAEVEALILPLVREGYRVVAKEIIDDKMFIYLDLKKN